MLISKEQFIYFANKFKQAHEEQKKFHGAIRPFFDFPVCTYRDDLANAYESLLVAVCECYDEDGIFGWWVENHPNNSKLITVRDTTTGDEDVYDVEPVEGLYNYLYDMYHKE